jgi:hypothetical protein
VIVEADFHGADLELFRDVDHLVIDPPYSPHVHENAVSAGTLDEGSAGYHHRDLKFPPLTHEDRVRTCSIAAVVKGWTVIHSDYEGAHWWLVEMRNRPVDYVRLVPWVRWSQPQKSGDRPGQQSEAVLHFHRKGAKLYNGPGALIAYGLQPGDDADTVRRTRRALRAGGPREKHPTEKPLDLALDLVSYHSQPGQVIADLYGGAGTTAVACALLDRDAVVFERLPEFSSVAIEREAGALAGRLDERDHTRAVEWCITTEDEARAVLASKPKADGSDRNTREKATRRLADVARVARKVAA